MASFYDAEDLDPDSIPKSSKFVMMGQAELSYFFRSVPSQDQEVMQSAAGVQRRAPVEVGPRLLQGAILGCGLPHQGVQRESPPHPSRRSQKVTDALLAALEKNAGGVSAEQKKNWEELLNKAYADMHTWGWY